MGNNQSTPAERYLYDEIKTLVKVGDVVRIPKTRGRPDKFVIITEVTARKVMCVHLKVEGELSDIKDKWADIVRRNRSTYATYDEDAVKRATYVEKQLEEVMADDFHAIIEKHDEKLAELDLPHLSQARKNAVIKTIKQYAAEKRQVAFDEILSNHEHWVTYWMYGKSFSTQVMSNVCFSSFIHVFVIGGAVALFAWFYEFIRAIPVMDRLANWIRGWKEKILAELPDVAEDVLLFLTNWGSMGAMVVRGVVAIVCAVLIFYYLSLRNLVTRERDIWLCEGVQIIDAYMGLTCGAVFMNMWSLVKNWVIDSWKKLVEWLKSWFNAKSSDDENVYKILEQLATGA